MAPTLMCMSVVCLSVHTHTHTPFMGRVKSAMVFYWFFHRILVVFWVHDRQNAIEVDVWWITKAIVSGDIYFTWCFVSFFLFLLFCVSCALSMAASILNDSICKVLYFNRCIYDHFFFAHSFTRSLPLALFLKEVFSSSSFFSFIQD